MRAVMDDNDKIQLFDFLKSILSGYTGTLNCTEDSFDNYQLFTDHIMENGKPLYFGGVKINKSFVSYHLMPVYVFPDLVSSISENLSKSMKGKSCFNFKKLDEQTLVELKDLTQCCYKKYQSEGFV